MKTIATEIDINIPKVQNQGCGDIPDFNPRWS